ncbi:MAG: amidohydrolase [Cyclobacteriaceae bacterium]
MQDLTITLIQTPLHWHNAQANLGMLEEKIWQIEGKTDLIILPEMFNSGFTMKAADVAEVMNFTTFKWMKQMAAQTGAVLTGSFVVREEKHFYNRLIYMRPDGTFDTYDKRHLFRMADEHHTYTAGTAPLICELKGWKICPMVCYDLRFPVWSRNTSDENGSMAYDLLLYVANWPAPRVNAWDILLQARAVENLCYTAGVNRVGEDGNGIPYAGHSAVYNPKGETVCSLDEDETIVTTTLSGSELLRYREKFPAYLDADPFSLSL